MSEYELHIVTDGGDYSAVFEDGKRIDLGCQDVVMERLLDRLGVQTVYSSDFLRGGNGRTWRTDEPQPAANLAEVEEYRSGRVKRQEAARQKRAEAERLLAEAKELEG